MHSVDVTPEMRESVMEGQPMFLRTDSGEVYGFTKDGKIYIDPRKATAETPVHEFTHLWADGMRKANPKAWEQLKSELEKEKDLFDYVKSLYPELSGDDLMDEVFAHFSGWRGAERLRSEQEKMMQKANGIFDKAKITTMFDRLRNILHDFWAQARDLFAGKTEGIERLSAEDFADMALADLIKGVKPLGEGQSKETRETALRDGLIDKLRSAGIEVITDEEEAQRVLDADRERRARLMGSRVEKRKQEIAETLSGKEMSDEQQAVVDVFTGRKNRVRIQIARDAGNAVSIELQQGNEQGAGTKHSIHRHYATRSGYYTADEILLVPDIVKTGRRHETTLDNGKEGFVYQQEKDGVRYTVLTEVRGGKETFNDFYTNRKNTSSDDVNAQGDTDLTARSSGSVSGAKLQKVSDFANYSPVFYSNAEKAVEGISQNKATAEQWLAMIQKQGGLKAGEDKWLGLRDWLTERKGQSLTKEELLDYIRENQVHVDEVSYTANPQGFEDLKREYDGEDLTMPKKEADKALQKLLANGHKVAFYGDEYKPKYDEHGNLIEQNTDPQPKGKGMFGNIYDQFKGKAKEAIAFLLQKKEGEATGALHHKDIGDIDLVWGEEGTGKSDGFGLAKLVKYHPEVLDNLQNILDDMHVVQRSDNRVRLESVSHQAAVRLTCDNQKKNWLLTAFEKKQCPRQYDGHCRDLKRRRAE